MKTDKIINTEQQGKTFSLFYGCISDQRTPRVIHILGGILAMSAASVSLTSIDSEDNGWPTDNTQLLPPPPLLLLLLL